MRFRGHLRAAWQTLAAAAALLLVQPAWADPAPVNLALIVGVSDYPNGHSLPNGANDANAIAARLPDLGFTLVGGKALIDPDFDQVEKQVKALSEAARVAAKSGADVTVLFYFSGHGVQFDGTNYLIPHQAKLFDASSPPDQADYKREALRAQQDVLDRLAASGARRVILILDACRVNPFHPRDRGATIEGGLGAMVPPEVDNPPDALIFYAAEPRRPAADGTGSNSPFSGALARALQFKGMSADELFSNVRRQVIAETGKVQRPYFEGALIDYRFGAGAGGRGPEAPGTGASPAGAVRTQSGGAVDVNRPGPDVLDAVVKRQPLSSIRDLAEKGDGFNQWLLSIAYVNGDGLPKDVVTGRKWARQAIYNGVARATSTLAWTYLNAGEETNWPEAIGWYETGVAQKDASALNNLAMLCSDSLDPEDRLAAVRMFKQSAKLGYSGALHFLGRLYIEHLDDPQLQRQEDGADLASLGRRYIEQAFDAGWAPAADDLAGIYGPGSPAADAQKAAFYAARIQKPRWPGSEPAGQPSPAELHRACAAR